MDVVQLLPCGKRGLPTYTAQPVHMSELMLQSTYIQLRMNYGPTVFVVLQWFNCIRETGEEGALAK